MKKSLSTLFLTSVTALAFFHTAYADNKPTTPPNTKAIEAARKADVAKRAKLEAARLAAAKKREEEAIAIGTEAYIYGYPLVTMDLTRQVTTNVEEPEGTRAPMGQFANLREYPDASFRDVTTPNADTLYSSAWIDVSEEPYVFHIPAQNGRYFLMPMLSGWTNVFASPGQRTTGTGEQNYLIVGPNWDGELPAGMKKIKSPTNIVWILGRTYCNGTPDDYAAAHKIQDDYKVTPLSAYGQPYTPPAGVINPNLDMQTPVRDQVNAMETGVFFNRLAELMRDNPPGKADASIVARMAKLGITPGEPFDIATLDPYTQKGLNAGIIYAKEKIAAKADKSGVDINGWTYTSKTGSYGNDYLQRAMVAEFGLGANLPQDAIYPSTKVDSSGKTLNGAHQYIIHFAKDAMPPVEGFWSLTMYNTDYFFAPNPLNKYTVSPRNNLVHNTDGSVDLYIQHQSPGAAIESNWLPAPRGDFILMFRFYWPQAELIDGTWKIPPVVMKTEQKIDAVTADQATTQTSG